MKKHCYFILIANTVDNLKIMRCYNKQKKENKSFVLLIYRSLFRTGIMRKTDILEVHDQPVSITLLCSKQIVR